MNNKIIRDLDGLIIGRNQVNQVNHLLLDVKHRTSTAITASACRASKRHLIHRLEPVNRLVKQYDQVN